MCKADPIPQLKQSETEPPPAEPPRACFDGPRRASCVWPGRYRRGRGAGPPELSDMPTYRWAVAAAWLLGSSFFSDLSAAPGRMAQPHTPYTIDVWETDDGLPQTSVIAMTQTRDGYLWLGTLNGLARFDGLHFTIFDEGNTPGLNSSRIVKLFEDSHRNLWIGTETAGVVLVLATDRRVRPF